MKKNQWKNKQSQTQDNLLVQSSNFIEKQLTRAYQEVAKSVIADAEDLYLEMLEEGEMTQAKLFRYDRYYRLNASINQELKRLGTREIEMLDRGMNDLYLRTGALITGNPSWAIINKAFAEEAVRRIWCADGKLWSDRVWEHKTALQQELQSGIMNCVIAGRDHRKLVRDLQERFDVAHSAADRLVRTELNHIQNQGAMRGYLDAGYTHYQFISAIDNRTCDECEDLDGQVFAFADAVEGINFPPIHPNCRSNIIGYKEE